MTRMRLKRTSSSTSTYFLSHASLSSCQAVARRVQKSGEALAKQ